MSELKVGDTVAWTSQASGHTKEKIGTIIHVVEPGADIPESILAEGRAQTSLIGKRSKTSYLVRVERLGKTGKPVRPMIYWPLPDLLKKVEKTEEHSTAA